MNRLLALIVLLGVAWIPTVADPPPSRFELTLGAFSPRLDTRIRLDGGGGMIGVELDLEDGFNLSDVELVPVMGMDLWISKKHGLSAFVFDLSRASVGESTIEFRFGDQIFPANVPLSIQLDTQVVALTYSYKFFHNDRRSFGFNVGLNINRFDAGITTESGFSIEESGSMTAPLPVFGVNGHVMLSRKWGFHGMIGFFGLSYDKYDGVLSTLSLGFSHQTFKHVGFGIGYYGFTIQVDSEDDDFLGRIEYNYKGPAANLHVRF